MFSLHNFEGNKYRSKHTTSNFLYFRGSDIGVVLFDCVLGRLNKIALAFVVLWESMDITVGAVTSLAAVSEKSYFLFAGKAFRVVTLFWLWDFWDFEL